ncbi:nucleoside-diphosphate-sugar epimerase [Maribacter caenipelagi]|uniref:Nucleoside-diphosphate-sugar epimerase n=1 Tax=Maribacter caenipelagi TaxID=1447781 RepID=A0A4R7DEZ7_9FLAO|nr:SDR family oxidoreductase [Maribacter caenipelagi]TDS18925.1 nucleoside-diphosphate-sugar epimerase [Maribacter caenipelagi]
MTKKIGVIGCGWLGLPLAESLIATGYSVNGTSTSDEKISVLKKKGITPFKIALSENEIKGDIDAFLDSVSVLVINIPPKLRGKGPKESYITKITLLHQAIKKSGVKNIIFASSTAVYGDTEGIVTEKTPPHPTTESGIQLVQCENLLKNDKELNTTIIRFGGLIGPNRHPVTMLSGRENLSGGDAPINLIHLDDCIGIIKRVIEYENYNDVLNAVYPEHPTKKEYYTKQAAKRSIPAPQYDATGKNQKIVYFCSIFLINKYNFLTSIN